MDAEYTPGFAMLSKTLGASVSAIRLLTGLPNPGLAKAVGGHPHVPVLWA